MSDRWIALYSAEAAQTFGTTFWVAEDGREIECTAVFPVGSDLSTYEWEDKVDLGEVIKWSRPGQGKNPSGVSFYSFGKVSPNSNIH
ncbi:hypothetical protein [Microvirga sp. P5_D2]